MKDADLSDRLADHGARERIRTDLDTTLAVEAAAGTGKTSELVRRMAAVLMAGRTTLDRMIAVTFTDAAAGELKLRLRGEIERQRQHPGCPDDARDRLRAALPMLEEARIGTIHSFCGDLLRQRPVEAGVDPLFEVAPNDVAQQLFGRAFDRWFEAQLANPSEAVRRILRRRPSDEGPRGLLRAAAWDLIERRDFPARWRPSADFDREAVIDAVMDRMAKIAGWAAAGDAQDYFTKSLLEIKRFYDEVIRKEELRGRDYDGLEALLFQVPRKWHWDWKGWSRADESFPKTTLMERRAELRVRIDEFRAAAGADLAPKLRDDLWAVVDAYEQMKERAGCMDFLDLLLRARNLVRDSREVREDLQRQFTHIYVDEFQDTDPLQAEILMLIAADAPAEQDWRRVRPVRGKLFIVGDPKQSIYRFRRADVTLYEAVKQQIITSGGALLDLTVSFRAVPEIQHAVNAAFQPVMQGQSQSQARYVPLAPHRPGVESQPAIVALPVPAPYSDYGKIAAYKIDESLPEAIAGFVEWLVRESGWTVTEKESPGDRVPIHPRHICILFRRFKQFNNDVTRAYVRALEARHLPHLLVGGSQFHSREEVEALRNALSAIERPEDELAVFATLRGPLFGYSDAALLAFRARCGSLHPYRQLPEDLAEPLQEVEDALTILRDLHRGRNSRPIADTIGRLLAATRSHAALAIWPTGEQALANISRLMDLARRAERNGVNSFRSFVDWLIDQAETGEASDAPIIEEGTEGVRMMTVHRAKGLEFPVVILADMTAHETASEPARWVDSAAGLCAMRLAGCIPPELAEHKDDELAREREEAARVLYVAATRARDLLVVPVVGDEQREGWVGLLNPVVYPPKKMSRTPVSTEPPGCPQFGEESTPGRPQGKMPSSPAVVPGLHRPETGEHTVVWFDPVLLRLDVEEMVGLTQQKLLVNDEAGIRSEAGIRAHTDWQKWRSRVRLDGAKPSVQVMTATELAEESRLALETGPESRRRAADAWSGIEVSVEQTGVTGPRPHGKRFGILVHAVLSVVDLNASRDDIAAAAELQARIYGAERDEVQAAVESVVQALAHPLLRRAAAAQVVGGCRREVPIAMKLEDGLIVEGVVDLAFAEGDEKPVWTVVDFKTDFEIEGRSEEYRTQVALYAAAIGRATGQVVRGVLLRV